MRVEREKFCGLEAGHLCLPSRLGKLSVVAWRRYAASQIDTTQMWRPTYVPKLVATTDQPA